MDRNEIRKILLILIAIFLPWNNIIGNIFFIIATIVSLYSLIIDKKLFKTIFSLKYIAATSIVYIYIFGVFYSDDIKYGLSFVQTTLSLLFFPIVFQGISFKKKDVETIALSFIISHTATSILVLSSIIIEMFKNGIYKNWYFQKIESFGGLHPTYMSVFSIITILVSLYLLSQKKQKWLYLIVIFHIFILFILASRIAIVTFIVIAVIYSLYLGFKNKTSLKLLIGLYLGLFSFIVILFIANPDLKYKFAQLKNFKTLKYNKYDASSVSTRIAKWKSAIHIFKDNNPLIGTGTGDMPKDLLKQYYKLDCLDCKVHKYNNPHNQYLDALARNGILGVLALLLVLFYPLKAALTDKNIYHLLFIITFLIVLTTECLFNREKGIQLFGFFYWFFYLIKRESL